MLSANQPDLGTKRWYDLWQDCTEEQRMELDIRLTAATTPARDPVRPQFIRQWTRHGPGDNTRSGIRTAQPELIDGKS